MGNIDTTVFPKLLEECTV